MGFRLYMLLNPLQRATWRGIARLGCETWGLTVRRWAPRTWPLAAASALCLFSAMAAPPARLVATGAGGLLLAAAALPWVAALGLHAVNAAFNWRAAQASRAAHRPPRRPDGSVDWAAIDSYVRLSEAAFYDTPRTLDGLMAGPVERFIQLCEDVSVPVRGRARAMEFARGAPAAFKRRRARSAEARRMVDERVLEELERRLGGMGSDGRYLIDVYLGKRTHNG